MSVVAHSALKKRQNPEL